MYRGGDLARIDPLTQALNRRGLEELLQRELAHQRRARPCRWRCAAAAPGGRVQAAAACHRWHRAAGRRRVRAGAAGNPGRRQHGHRAAPAALAGAPRADGAGPARAGAFQCGVGPMAARRRRRSAAAARR
ncbi:hypothetical protein G6F40_016204 [Rhizopus arrhizus]|nr:hypothetical protein G6F40_016204 [Rhizopus arrhizus]